MKTNKKDLSWTAVILIVLIMTATSYTLFHDVEFFERTPEGCIIIGAEKCCDMVSLLQDNCEPNFAYIESKMEYIPEEHNTTHQ